MHHLPLLVYLWKILIKSSLKMYFCFCCVCNFYNIYFGEWFPKWRCIHAHFQSGLFCHSLFKKWKNGTLPSHLPHRSLNELCYWKRELLLAHQGTCRGEIWAGLWGFLGRRHPPHKCEWIMPLESHCSCMKHLLKALVTFFNAFQQAIIFIWLLL